MSDNTTDASSATSPWVRAAMATVIGTLVYFYLSGASVGQALIFGILFFGVFGFILSRMATKREQTEQAASAASAAVTQAVENQVYCQQPNLPQSQIRRPPTRPL